MRTQNRTYKKTSNKMNSYKQIKYNSFKRLNQQQPQEHNHKLLQFRQMINFVPWLFLRAVTKMKNKKLIEKVLKYPKNNQRQTKNKNRKRKILFQLPLQKPRNKTLSKKHQQEMIKSPRHNLQKMKRKENSKKISVSPYLRF